MALTGTNRGQGATNTPDEFALVVAPASNCTAGALLVLCANWDNTGSNGIDPFDSIFDSQGNTWTPRVASLNDPGAPNAGVAGRIFTCPQDVAALTTGDTITVSFGLIKVVGRVWTLMEFTGNGPHYSASGQETSASGSPTITTASISNGQAVVGMIGREGNDAVSTEDTDTDSGTWSAAQTAGIGTTTAGQQICTQRKIVTADATQTYNPTFAASRDNVELWLSVAETPNVVVTPTAAQAIADATLIVGIAASVDVTPSSNQVNADAPAPSASSELSSIVTPSAGQANATAPSSDVALSVTVNPAAAQVNADAPVPATATTEEATVIPAAGQVNVDAPAAEVSASISTAPVSASVAATAPTASITLEVSTQPVAAQANATVPPPAAIIPYDDPSPFTLRQGLQHRVILPRGDEMALVDVTLQTSDGKPVNLAGLTIQMRAVQHLLDTSREFTINGTVTDAPNGVVRFIITAAHTGSVRHLYASIHATGAGISRTLTLFQLDIVPEVQ